MLMRCRQEGRRPKKALLDSPMAAPLYLGLCVLVVGTTVGPS